MLTNFLQNGQEPRRVHVYADKGYLLTLSDFRMALGEAGLELDIAGQILETYYRGHWITIGAEMPNRISRGGILVVRIQGVTNLHNWDVDKQFLA